MIRRNGISNTATIGTVTIGASTEHIGQIGGTTTKSNNNFTRLSNTTPYIANQVVSSRSANTTALGIAGPRSAGGTGYITSIKLVTNNVLTTGVIFRVHFGTTDASFSNVQDGTALALNYNKSSNNSYLGYIDLPATTTQGGNGIAYAQDITQRFPFYTESNELGIYYIIETLTAFTPISDQEFSLQLGLEQN